MQAMGTKTIVCIPQVQFLERGLNINKLAKKLKKSNCVIFLLTVFLLNRNILNAVNRASNKLINIWYRRSQLVKKAKAIKINLGNRGLLSLACPMKS